MTELEPLDDTLADLIGAERRAPGPAPGTDARVRQAVMLTVAATAATASSAAASAAASASVAKAATATAASAATSPAVATTSLGAGILGSGGAGLAIVAAVAATAGGTVLVSRYELPEQTALTAPAPAIVEVLPEVPRPAAPPGLIVESSTTAAPTTSTPKPRIEAKPATATTTAADDVVDDAALAKERAIIAEAREALRRDDGARALIALQAHRDAFVAGQLVEEREALTVMALRAAGQDGPAAAAAARFRARYPSSIFTDALRALDDDAR